MIAPYKRPPKCPDVGLVRRDRRVMLSDGTVVDLANAPTKGVRLYADRDQAAARAIAGEGELLCWNDLPIRWEVDGYSVTLLGGHFGDDLDAFDGLVRFRAWVASVGATVGSTSATSASILRASIERPLRINGGKNPPTLGEVVGGRQEAGLTAGRYGDFESWDMEAAYARTMGEICYPGANWRAWPGEVPEDSPLPSFVSAVVTIPPMRWGPLPRRGRAPEPSAILRRLAHREYPIACRLAGVWAAEEVRAARAAGCRVKVRKTWVQLGPDRHPFAPWWAIIQDGRRMPGVAGRLAKMVGNTLWSRFALFGERTLVRYDGRSRIVQPAPLPTMPKSMTGLDVAELVTSHVRTRVFRDLLAPYGDMVWSIHTDGGLVDADAAPLTFPEDWRRKDVGHGLTYLGPQTYAYRRGDHPVYKVAGVRPELAARTFHSIASQVLGYRTLDAIPPETMRDLKEHFPEAIDDLMRRTSA